jgi:hypothetical protein
VIRDGSGSRDPGARAVHHRDIDKEAQVREYEIQNAEGVTLIVQLDDDAAKAMGAKPVSTKEAAAPKNKARSAAKKS